MKDMEININTQAIAAYVKEHPACSLFLLAEILFTVAGMIAFHGVIDVVLLLGILCVMAGVTVALSNI